MSAMAWLMVTYHYLPSLCRTLRQALHLPGGMLRWDSAGTTAALIGITQTSFSCIWIFLGQDEIPGMSRVHLGWWLVAYIMNAACAVGLLHTWRDSRTDQFSLTASDRRSSDALAAWLALAVLCVGAASWSL